MSTQTDKTSCCPGTTRSRFHFPGIARRSAPSQFMSARISSNESRWMIELDCPGVQVEEIDISIDNRHLIISMDQKVATRADDSKVLVDERFRANAKRSYYLHEDIDQDSIDAELKDGVLTVVLSLRQKDSKSINVRNANQPVGK